MKAHTYKGISIEPCEWAGNPHGGRWAIRTRHLDGWWADQECAHVHTLAEAKERINEWAYNDYLAGGSGRVGRYAS